MLNIDPTKIYLHFREADYRYQILWFDDIAQRLVTRCFRNGEVELWTYISFNGRFVETEEDVLSSEDYTVFMQNWLKKDAIFADAPKLTTSGDLYRLGEKTLTTKK